MGNGILGRFAARRQARIITDNQRHCCNTRVYYCHQPAVQCRTTVVHPQATTTYTQPQRVERQTKSIVSNNETPKPTKLELDFNGMQSNTIKSNTALGKWLKNKRETNEVNMFKVGDVHIMEVQGDSPKLQFFDKAGNKWQALSQEQTIKFISSKRK